MERWVEGRENIYGGCVGMKAKPVLIAMISALVAFANSDAARAEIGGETEGDGANLGMTLEEVRNLPAVPGRGGSGSTSAGQPVLFEYKTTLLCDSGSREDPDCRRGQDGDERCAAAGRPGPMSIVWRREVGFSGGSGWQRIGQTCFPEDVPGGKNKPQLTLAAIRTAWSRTNFAKPQVSMQPVRNKTLVDLPVFYQITWPTAGFQPQEVNTVDLLGYTVRIRPTFHTNQYHYGDGQSSGPTTSFGGTYPDGDITHPFFG